MYDYFVWRDLEDLMPVRPCEVSIEHRRFVHQLVEAYGAARVRQAFCNNGYTMLYAVPDYRREQFLLAVEKDLER